jgi:hypothetical protein
MLEIAQAWNLQLRAASGRWRPHVPASAPVLTRRVPSASGDAGAARVQDDFAALVHAVQEGRVLYDNLKKTIAYTMAHIAPEIGAVAISILLGVPLGLGALITLSIDLLTEQVRPPACCRCALPCLSASRQRRSVRVQDHRCTCPPHRKLRKALDQLLVTRCLQGKVSLSTMLKVVRYEGSNCGPLGEHGAHLHCASSSAGHGRCRDPRHRSRMSLQRATSWRGRRATPRASASSACLFSTIRTSSFICGGGIPYTGDGHDLPIRYHRLRSQGMGPLPQGTAIPCPCSEVGDGPSSN